MLAAELRLEEAKPGSSPAASAAAAVGYARAEAEAAAAAGLAGSVGPFASIIEAGAEARARLDVHRSQVKRGEVIGWIIYQYI